MESPTYKLFVRVVSASDLTPVTGQDQLEVAEAVEGYVRYLVPIFITWEQSFIAAVTTSLRQTHTSC